MDIIDLTETNNAPQSSHPNIKLPPTSSQLHLVATAKANPSSFVNLISDDERKCSDKKRARSRSDSGGNNLQGEEGEIVDEKSRRANDRMDTSRHSRKRRNKSPALFFIDDQPTNIPKQTPHSSASAVGERVGSELIEASNESTNNDAPLLLPSHVTLDSGSSEVKFVDEISTLLGAEDDSIFFADLEDARNTGLRYYEEPKDDTTRRSHYLCAHCGIEGEHKTANCPVVVCLLCGAHNEHSTRGCPISKTCFKCGLKGHISKDCAEKNKPYYQRDHNAYSDCDRCGSDTHSTKECPTLWRMYEYVDDSERERMLKLRRAKENAPIGKGGEGYVGDDIWCYNCGMDGHLGDDCGEAKLPDHPREPSAFSTYNVLSGPFADISLKSSDRTFRREWETDNNFDDGHGFRGLGDVGRRARAKERERMGRREKERLVSDDDNEDWFSNRIKSNQETRSQKDKRRSSQKKEDTRDSNRLKTMKPGDRLLARMSSGQGPQYSDDSRQGKEKEKREPHRREIAKRSERPERERVSRQRSERDIRSSEKRNRQKYYGGYGR